MTMVSMRPALRLVLLVVMVAFTSPLTGCGLLALPGESSDVGRRPPGFTEVYHYTDGIEVQVSEVWAGRRLGLPVVELSVTIRNNSEHSFEAWIQADLLCGTYRLPAVRYLTPPGPDDNGSVQHIAIGGTSDPYRVSFVLPHRSRDVMLQIAVDAGQHDPAVFVGEL